MSPSLTVYGLLALAIISEVTGSTFLPKSDGFTKPIPTAITVVCFVFAFYLLSQVVKTLPIWSGVGIVLTAISGYFILGNKLDLPAIGGMALIILGVIVINVFSKSAGH